MFVPQEISNKKGDLCKLTIVSSFIIKTHKTEIVLVSLFHKYVITHVPLWCEQFSLIVFGVRGPGLTCVSVVDEGKSVRVGQIVPLQFNPRQSGLKGNLMSVYVDRRLRFSIAVFKRR